MYSVANPTIILPDEEGPSVYVWSASPTFSVPNVQQEDETLDAHQFLTL